jgi:hypothetical protein
MIKLKERQSAPLTSYRLHPCRAGYQSNGNANIVKKVYEQICYTIKLIYINKTENGMMFGEFGLSIKN